jgi:hypothetical protein
VLDGVCGMCDATARYFVDNLLRGKTTSCVCQRNVKYHDHRTAVLGERYDAMVQRCKDTGTAIQRNYGARGIKNMFSSREDYIYWVLHNLPHKDYKSVDIDRKNNEGHYEPGNLRLLTRSQNLRNKRTTRSIECQGQILTGNKAFQEWLEQQCNQRVPISTVTRWLLDGKNPEEIYLYYMSRKLGT